jgi:hypothetical protein
VAVFSKAAPTPPYNVVRGSTEADYRAWELLWQHLNRRQRKEILGRDDWGEPGPGFVVKGEQCQWLIMVDGGVGRVYLMHEPKLRSPQTFLASAYASERCIVPQGRSIAPWCDYLLATRVPKSRDWNWPTRGHKVRPTGDRRPRAMIWDRKLGGWVNG